jgi:hypothetical protein
MLGSSAHPVLSAKAKECHGLLAFAVAVLEEHAAQFRALGGDNTLKWEMLLASGREALAFDSILTSHGRNMNEQMQETLLTKFVSHCIFFQRSGNELKPKHHAMYHCIRRIHLLGNPQHYHTYRDESLNGSHDIQTVCVAEYMLRFWDHPWGTPGTPWLLHKHPGLPRSAPACTTGSPDHA